MIKAAVVLACGASLGLLLGWTVHHSKYGKVAEFGPFSTSNDLTATSAATFVKSKTQVGSPRIEVVGGEEFDFGVMEPDSKGEHQFLVRNVGEYPLTLEIIGSTCKCTIGELAKSSIGPGEQTEIKLTWKVKSTGEDFGQSAMLKTNDPTRGDLQLKIKGRVISQMTMVPRSFSFGQVESGESIKLDALIYSFESEPIVALKPTFSDTAIDQLATFQVEEVPVDAATDAVYATATQAFKVTGEIRPGLPQGAVQQNFLFNFINKSDTDSDGKFDEQKVKRFATPIAGRIVGAITMVETSKCQSLEGGYLYSLGRIDPATAKPERANIMLRGKFKDSLKLSLGDVEPAGLLMAELGEPVGRGSVLLYPLRLWLDPEAKSGERLGNRDDDYGVVWIKTDNADVPPLRLRVRFAVAKP